MVIGVNFLLSKKFGTHVTVVRTYNDGLDEIFVVKFIDYNFTYSIPISTPVTTTFELFPLICQWLELNAPELFI